jgi:hypothetical protein
MRHHRLTRSVAIAAALAALAGPASAAADQSERALHLRSQALNEQSVGAHTMVQAEHALHLRSQALNDRYAAGATVGSPRSRGGIDWTDAGVGAGALLLALSLVSLSAYVVVRRRRADPARRRPATAA